MPKRSRSIQDKFYQEWHIKRAQAVINADEEWIIDVPRPLKSPPSGSYWAVELHAIEFLPSTEIVTGAVVVIDWALTTSPRTGKTPFMTGPGDPENLWRYGWHCAGSAAPTDHVLFEWTHDKYRELFTDDLGHGKLIIPEHIYLQVQCAATTSVLAIGLSLCYTFTTVSCSEFVQELVGQLNEA